jgi:RNA polymerase sigma-70 factor, ECF subfamily
MKGNPMAATREERFEGLFRANYPAVRAYALRRAAADAAQDVVSETFLVAWRRLDDVPADALPWLYGVARRVLANQRRTANRGAALQDRIAGATPRAAASDPGDSAGDAEILRLALGRLSEPSREALMLVAWHGLSGPRAARAAGCSRATFAVRLHRARASLAAEVAALQPNPIAEVESLEAAP